MFDPLRHPIEDAINNNISKAKRITRECNDTQLRMVDVVMKRTQKDWEASIYGLIQTDWNVDNAVIYLTLREDRHYPIMNEPINLFPRLPLKRKLTDDFL
jgi:hypothetical protein